MELFLKILFFIFTMIVTEGEVKSSTEVNILQEEMPVSLFQEMESISVGVENHFENSCKNGESVVTYSEWVRGVEASAAKGGASIAKTPVGRSGNVMSSVAKNSPTTINGTKFTGHALDQMQARGIISPSSVLDVVKNPAQMLPGNTPGTTVFIRDNLRVVTNGAGDIITVIWR